MTTLSPVADKALAEYLRDTDGFPDNDGKTMLRGLVESHEASVELQRKMGVDEPLILSTGNAVAWSESDAYERSICGAMMLWPDEMTTAWKNKAAGIAEPGKALFRFEHTRLFFGMALRLRKMGLAVDPVTIAKNCDNAEIEAIGGLFYAIKHVDFCFCMKSSIACLDAMVKEYRARQAKQVLGLALESADDAQSLNNTITLVNEQLTKLLTSEAEMTTPSVDVVLDAVDKLVRADAEPDTIPSSFRKFAEKVGDYRRKQIVVIGAPPGHAKTAFAMQEIDCALTYNFTVDAFLMETSFAQYTERYLSRNAVIPNHKFKSKFFTQDEYRRISEAQDRLSEFENRLHLSGPGGKTAAEIDAMIQNRKAATGLPCDLIVVDHLKRMNHVVKKGQSAYNAEADTLQYLSDIAARENAAMLLLDQLTVEAVRGSFTKDSKMPGIGAFRGGTVGEFAKVMVILHKDEQEMLKDSVKVVDQLMIIVKANDGSTGAIPSKFIKPLTAHMEDCDWQDRQRHADWLQAFGYDLTTPRKELK